MIDGKGEILIQKMRMIGFSEECLDNLGKILSSPFPPPLTTSTIPNTHSPQRK